MARQNVARANLARDPVEYQLQRLNNPKFWTEAELRKEYSRLRAIAQKRIKRLEKSEFAEFPFTMQQAELLLSKKSKSLPGRAELALGVRELSSFIQAKTSTVSGQKATRRNTIESLHAAGFTGITEKNYSEFGKFMEWYRNKYGTAIDSVRAAEIYDKSKELGMPVNEIMANFEDFDKHREAFYDLKKIEIEKSGSRISSADVFKAIGADEVKINKLEKEQMLGNWYRKHSKEGNWAKR